ncbi:TonB-dependent receptor [Granulicella arctica]|uniref:Carboxypeptidase regulatory-like domain-containing protein n=1 Tax=Granulicella arctica TaxID=940613 RepID=A0A7Y9PI33_9BACT|nr:TonB-dependent receptor [Granulicella arctica]NYF80314.1 hypothetical protein [Granulicella arctica]
MRAHFFGEAIDAQGATTVQRFRIEFVLATLVVLLASPMYCVAQHAVVSGVVRDRAGTAQLGVLVEITAANSAVVGRAFTDLRGRYLVNNLTPGLYGVQATAAMFTPALKSNLQLHAGVRAIVNLTMSAIFDTTAWLPAERRKADEPGDDWMWTLRSATNRPILRMVEDGELVMVSSSATEGSHVPSTRGMATVTSGDGGFGDGGLHSVLKIDKAEEDGSHILLCADTGSGRTQFGVGPSMELSSGFERQTGFASTTRSVASVQSHPELISAGGVMGLQSMELTTAQRTKLGDLVDLEVGGTVYSVHTSGYAFVPQPFIRVVVEPSEGWSFGYRMATSRDVQGFSALNNVQPEVPVAVMSNGKLRTEQGRHQEISAGRKIGKGQVKVALYRDVLQRVALAGDGALTSVDLNSLGMSVNGFANGGMADAVTDSFRLLTSGYQAQGVNVMMTQPLGQNLWAAVEFSTGSGLAGDDSITATLPALMGSLKERVGKSAAFALKGTLPGTGTKVRAVYRWQPHDLVTPVDAYREFSDQAFLSFRVRQPMRWEGVLPPGLEASVDVTNLLAQGYQPFLSSDGRTLYLAQSPRTLQAGLSITF